MRVDCLERLRCPADHPSSPLITLATHRAGEHVIDGVLGCPICGAEFAIARGVAHLGPPPANGDATTNASAAATGKVDPWRLAALLDLTTPARRVLLTGTWAQAADALQGATEARCVVLNGVGAAQLMGTDAPDALSLPIGHRLPLGDATLDGLAVDGAHLTFLADAGRVLRSAGRLVAPVTAAIPDGCRELARDAELWVATADAASAVSAPVPLRRQSPPSA